MAIPGLIQTSILAAADKEPPSQLPVLIQNWLDPIIQWLPPGVRNLIPAEGWRYVLLILALVLLFLLGKSIQLLSRALKQQKKDSEWDDPMRIRLESCPLPAHSPSENRLAVYHVPVRIRLVVVAPVGKAEPMQMNEIPDHLDHVFPGLASFVMSQLPRIEIWPGQFSSSGFATLFHRCLIKEEPDGQPSQWIFLTGRAISQGRSFYIGLALWSDTKTGIGRRKLSPLQWLEVLRLIKPS